MGLGRGHWTQRMKPTRLEGAANGGELKALDVGFMEVRFAFCCVIWARPKNKLWIDFGYPTDNPRVGDNILIHARLQIGYEFDPRVKIYILT
jgi:hypothetical protein